MVTVRPVPDILGHEQVPRDAGHGAKYGSVSYPPHLEVLYDHALPLTIISILTGKKNR
jgi:hypothetical protein